MRLIEGQERFMNFDYLDLATGVIGLKVKLRPE
jgi:hypothetical protein